MEIRDIQWSQYDGGWWLSESSFYCSWEVQSMSDIWRSWFRLGLTWPFLQLANELRDTDLLQLLHARLIKNQNLIANKVDGVRDDVQHVANKVIEMHEDVVKQIRAKTQRLATLPSSDTIVQQMPLNQRSSMDYRRNHPVPYQGGNISRVYSRRRRDGKDFSCTGRCRTVSHQGTVSTRKHCLGSLHWSYIGNSPPRNPFHPTAVAFVG